MHEYSWKQKSGDAFKPPKHQKTLNVIIGTRFEVLCILIISIIISLIGFVYPEIRLKLINYIFINCITFSII